MLFLSQRFRMTVVYLKMNIILRETVAVEHLPIKYPVHKKKSNLLLTKRRFFLFLFFALF